MHGRKHSSFLLDVTCLHVVPRAVPCNQEQVLRILARTSIEDSRVERWTVPGLMIVLLPNNPENVYIFMREYLSHYLTI